MDYSYTYEQFKLYFPSLARVAKEQYPIGRFELAAEITENRTVIFNELYHSARILGYTRNEIVDEETWRNESRWRFRSMMFIYNGTCHTIAEDVDISEQTLSTYSRGTRTMSAYNAYKLAIAMDCHVNEFVNISFYPGVVNDRRHDLYIRGDVYVMSEEEWREEFIKRLKYVMDERSIDTTDLTRILEVSPSLIYKYSSGKVTPSAYKIYLLANKLKCDVDFLTDFTDMQMMSRE